MKLVRRPTKLQETVRQWILLIPIATAVSGALAVGSEEAWVDFLPPLFFVGALIVTSAMLHQRRMAHENMMMAEQVEAANDRLDTLHRLALDLSESLDVLPVARKVIDSSLGALGADAAALWLRRDLLPLSLLNPTFLAALPLQDTDSSSSDRWMCLAASGFEQGDRAPVLPEWDRVMEAGSWWGAPAESSTNALQRRSPRLLVMPTSGPSSAKSRAPGKGLKVSATPDEMVIESEELLRIFKLGNGAAVVPVTWEGEVVGALLVATWGRALTADSVFLARDIALVGGPALQNALSYSAATARAEIDGLTNLYNHRVLQERLSQELARASRALERGMEIEPAKKLSVAIMDVTDFKIFNDTYGHGTGDKVLQYIAECLRGSFRATDIVARYGGDEFVVVLPEADGWNSSNVCRRAVDFVASKPYEAADGSHVAVRIACGLATFPEDGTTIAELFSHADERLYAAKRAGKLMLDFGVDENGSATEPGTSTPVSPGNRVPPTLWKGLSVFESLVAAIDSKDKYTRRHTEAVWRHSMRLCDELNLSTEMREALHIAALVRDVGKIVVPDAILRKPGRLTDQEMSVMHQHTSFGESLVKDVPHLSQVLGGVRHHHERWDGKGYPDKLSGDRIPFVARILAVPDSFMAMTIDRPYRRAMTQEDALLEIEKSSGVQFDPIIVAAFARTMRAK